MSNINETHNKLNMLISLSTCFKVLYQIFYSALLKPPVSLECKIDEEGLSHSDEMSGK